MKVTLHRGITMVGFFSSQFSSGTNGTSPSNLGQKILRKHCGRMTEKQIAKTDRNTFWVVSVGFRYVSEMKGFRSEKLVSYRKQLAPQVGITIISTGDRRLSSYIEKSAVFFVLTVSNVKVSVFGMTEGYVFETKVTCNVTLTSTPFVCCFTLCFKKRTLTVLLACS
jgi:hypothetical protein